MGVTTMEHEGVSMFSKVLVANRGEIAVRVMRTCAELGVRTVAVYAAADAGARHVRVADEAVELGDGPAAETYLDIAKLIAAARATGAEAIHPGYGFLAESAPFAQAVADAGLTFIGPSAHAIRAMGEKVSARELALAADVPLLPGSLGAVADADAVREFGEAHGYPLLIKASYGGGGRGMREVAGADAVDDAFAGATREAAAAFGNGEVYVERYLVNARHVEVQVFGDHHGNVVYLGDRDCSVQRRHQKLVEEAPAPGLSADLRAAMGEAAVRLARAVDYVGAGTVEFLVEGERFYFLEMNTRIQVEHPVTEQVTGMDLVAEQLRVAGGAPLSVTESGRPPRGVSIEARINAEDVVDGAFFPAPGPLEKVDAPTGEHLRWDAGYEAGDEIPSLYDSLIGKLIAWGENREEAIDRLTAALAELRIEGVPTTAWVAAHILRTEDFRANTISTLWLERSVDLVPPEPESRREVVVGGRYYYIPYFAEGATAPGTPQPASNGEERRGPAAGASRRRTKGGDGTIAAPMQGTIMNVNVAPGDAVEAGQLLFVLEAMKMENPVKAPRDGTIETVAVAVGDSLAAGTVLARYAGAGE